ncbi:MAG: hypothetical protein ABI282_11070 [Candidatus Baltobacteraceae bacterium]
MTWNLIGITGSVALAAFAFWRSRASGGFYDAEVYGMNPGTHVRYGCAFFGFAAFLGLFWVLNVRIEIPVLAGLTLVAIFYLTSFLRGAHEDDG